MNFFKDYRTRKEAEIFELKDDLGFYVKRASTYEDSVVSGQEILNQNIKIHYDTCALFAALPLIHLDNGKRISVDGLSSTLDAIKRSDETFLKNESGVVAKGA